MAEAFFRKYAPRGYSTVSAGTSPADKINPTAIRVMKEVGIDISKQTKIKDNHRRDDKNAAVRVNMRCMDKDSCLTLFIHNLLE
jgi:arsenate reductase (thioredoxin)